MSGADQRGAEPPPPPERLADSPLLVALTPQQLARFIASGDTRRYRRGEQIIAEGETGDALYVILEGSVTIRHPDQRVMATLSGEDTMDSQYEGDFFGEMSVLDHEPRSATVVASSEEVELFRISKEKVFALFASDTDFQVVFLLNLARILSRRIRRSNTRRSSGAATTQDCPGKAGPVAEGGARDSSPPAELPPGVGEASGLPPSSSLDL